MTTYTLPFSLDLSDLLGGSLLMKWCNHGRGRLECWVAETPVPSLSNWQERKCLRSASIPSLFQEALETLADWYIEMVIVYWQQREVSWAAAQTHWSQGMPAVHHRESRLIQSLMAPVMHMMDLPNGKTPSEWKKTPSKQVPIPCCQRSQTFTPFCSCQLFHDIHYLSLNFHITIRHGVR